MVLQAYCPGPAPKKASYFTGKSILITGGTGSLGNQLVRHILPQEPKRLVILSRDELKQHEMRQKWSDSAGSPLRYFIGDVRDQDRLRRAFAGVDIVIHAAALKQVPAAEYNPAECIKTNVLGGMNVIEAALDAEVHQVLMISTDKAVAPTNLYGASKLSSEKLFVQANSYSGEFGTRFSVCRYGNVIGSRGSVVPLFQEQRKTGKITVTDERMTRFWITLEGAAGLVERSLSRMEGGEIFIPKLPSTRIADIAQAIAPDCERVYIGIRPGEKLHECLISEDEARHTIDGGEDYVILPEHPWWNAQSYAKGGFVGDWHYTSDSNAAWLSVDQLRSLLGEVAP